MNFIVPGLQIEAYNVIKEMQYKTDKKKQRLSRANVKSGDSERCLNFMCIVNVTVRIWMITVLYVRMWTSGEHEVR